ncbi:two-component regulator propeller domain-containing protein, partial [Rugamonas sp.]|uniref:ligand-binding sensor domain-containing diguanylate cyclase n=1 Tax=Rugamonas sp. TaxID=1926287 RepID=UPI0025E8268B
MRHAAPPPGVRLWSRPLSRLWSRLWSRLRRPASAAATLLTLLALLSGVTAAAAPSLRFKKLGPLGKDEPSMLALLQDRQGYIWIGTQASGLYRYNGYQSTQYRNLPGQPHSLPHDRVSALFEDGQGRIWAGTQNGLARFNPDSDDFTVVAPASGPNNYRNIKTIVSDGGHGLWLASWGGLQHYDPDSGAFALYAHDADDADSLASNDLNALARDARGGLWIATWPGGLDYLAPGARRFRHYPVAEGAGRDAGASIVRALQFDPRQRLWIGTEAGVLSWQDGSDWASRRQADTPASRVTGFLSDADGVLWVSTLSAGLLRWDGQRFEQYLHQADDPYSLPGDALRAVLRDRGGMLWVVSYTDGISLANLNTQGFRRLLPFHSRDGRPVSNTVLSLSRAPAGRLWLGSDLGLSLYDPAADAIVRSYRAGGGRDGGLAHDIVYSLYQQPDGPLWIGTSNGLDRLDGGRFRHIHFGAAASDFINAIAPAGDGALWLATGNSLIRYDSRSGASRRYLHDAAVATSRSADGSSTVLQDRHGVVWAGSEFNGGGLDQLDPASGRFRHHRHRDGDPASLADDSVSALHEDTRGRLWVGTAKGLNLALPQPDGSLRFRAYAALGTPKILAIASDAGGGVWCSTDAGLLQLDPARGAVHRYGAADGLTEGLRLGAALGGMAGAAWPDDGLLYFGGAHGMTAVAPAAVRSVAPAPQVAITDVSVYNRTLRAAAPRPGVRLDGPVTAPRALTLDWGGAVFALEFAALQYAEPGQNRYAYQLQGFDRDWVETDANRRSASYTNLDPGHYLFRVKAANPRGVWSAQPATLAVTITPPFWQRWWFRALAAVALAGALAGAHRWRIAALTRRQDTLEQLVALRTAELEASNAKLEALSSTDALTGLSNRRAFDLALAAEWRRASRSGQSLALLLCDVDFFKAYNDHYG